MSKIGKAEWMFLYAIFGILDIVQLVIGFTGYGSALNSFADPFIGVLLAAYFQLQGVSMIKHPTRLLSLIGITMIDGFTLGIAPAWVIDIWYIHHTVKKETAQMKKAEEEEKLRNIDIRRPLYEDGIRRPRIIDVEAKEGPANVDGIRRPGGGLNRAA